MPFGTLDKYSKDEITLILESEGAEFISNFPISDKVYDWMQKHPHQYKQGAVIEYAIGKDGKTIGKVGLAQQVPTPIQRSNTKIIDEKLKAVGVPPTGEINTPLVKANVPDVSVSARDALILQQSCLNRAVEIVAMEYPPYSFTGEQLRYTIIELKDQLFLDCWKKAGYPCK